MRCSSCEPVLDRYLEGTLPPRAMLDIAAHLRECAGCSALLDELRVVDGLLFTTSVPDLPQNFTFAVMAEVNAMPAHRSRSHPVWSFLALYSAAAWVAAVLALAFTGTSPRAAASALWHWLAQGGSTAGAFAASASQGFSHTTPALAAFGFGVLFLDASVAVAVAIVYFIVRPRLAAHLASVGSKRSS